MSVVLIPGFMLDQDLWSEIGADLAAFGPIIHADPTVGASITEMAQATLQRVDGPFFLIGFSMGGYIAREMVRIAPDRVRALILIATSARGDGQLQSASRGAADSEHVFRGISRSAVRRSLAPAREDDSALVERIRDMSVRLGPDVFRRQAAFLRQDDRGRLDYIRCPTLVVAGAQDRLRSIAEAEELRDGIQAARLEVIDAGHMIPLEAPDPLSLVLQAFLSRQPVS